jgi:hypothetical protein
MGNENGYNYALKQRRPRTSGHVPLLCIERQNLDDRPERPHVFRTPEEQAEHDAWVRQFFRDCGLFTDGEAETYAKQETDRDVAARLVALEALDPSQKRPTPKPSPLNSVAFIDL